MANSDKGLVRCGTITVTGTVVRVELDEIHFKGVHTDSISLKHHEYGNIDVPEWISDAGDENPSNVAAWVSCVTPSLEAYFTVEPAALTSIKVMADGSGSGPGDLDDPVAAGGAESTAAGGWKGELEFSGPWPEIKYYQLGDWHWDWKVTEINGSPVNYAITNTSHDLCFTANDPESEPVFKWVMLASCKAADGHTSSDADDIASDVFDGTGAGLGTVAYVDDWSTQLKYGGTNTSTSGDNTDNLLDAEEGMCRHFMQYFYDLCAAQGVGASEGLKKMGFQIKDKASNTNEIKWEGAYVASITAPSNYTMAASGTNITITADPTDVDGTISKVEFYESTNKLGEATSAPYTMVWSNVYGGGYSLTAVATDDDSNTGTSSEVFLMVDGETSDGKNAFVTPTMTLIYEDGCVGE